MIQVGTIQWLSLSLSLFWPLSMCDEVCQALRRCGRKRVEEEGCLSVVFVLTVTLGIRDASRFWHHVLRKRSTRPSTRQVQVEIERNGRFEGLNTGCLSASWPKSGKRGGIRLDICSGSRTSATDILCSEESRHQTKTKGSTHWSLPSCELTCYISTVLTS